MKLFVLINAVLILASQVKAQKLGMAVPAEDLLKVEDTVDAVNSDKIKFNFFRKGSPFGTLITLNTIEDLVHTAHDPSLESVYLLHGWKDNGNGNYGIKRALVKYHDVNVFNVDWNAYSKLDYDSAKSKLPEIGQIIGDFIAGTVNHFNVDINKVRLVGVSLGAHLAGFAGKSFNGRLASIIGLDPAGPKFEATKPETRLSLQDAQYVQVIHTNAGLLGCDFAIGHSDFWPNGGKKQPGCILDLVGICSHIRVGYLYAESLENNKFLSRKCISYTDYINEECNYEESAKMGGLQPNIQAIGDYYLKTEKKSPYGRN